MQKAAPEINNALSATFYEENAHMKRIIKGTCLWAQDL